MRINAVFVFLDGDDTPISIPEIHKRTGIPKHRLRKRAKFCKKRKEYAGKSCAVFTDRELLETIPIPYKVFVFVEGDDSPLTIPELAEKTGISKEVVRARAYLCEKTKYFNGLDCAVFTKKYLRKVRAIKSQIYIFFEGYLHSVSEIVAKTGVEPRIVRNRARNCKSKKIHNGKEYAVLTIDDLQRHATCREFEKRIPKFILKIEAWDRRVRERTVKELYA